MRHLRNRQKPLKVIFELIYPQENKNGLWIKYPEKGCDAVCKTFPDLKVHLDEGASIAELTQPLLDYLAARRKQYECKVWYHYQKKNEAVAILK